MQFALKEIAPGSLAACERFALAMNCIRLAKCEKEKPINKKIDLVKSNKMQQQ